MTDVLSDETVRVLDWAKQLFLAKDLAAFAEMFAEDGTHELPFAPPGVPAFLRGKANIRRYLTSITATPLRLTGFGEMSVHRTSDPEVVIAEYSGHGVVVSTGKPYTMPYVQVIRVHNGEIAMWRDYWSPLAGFRALGLRGTVSVLTRRIIDSVRRRIRR
ncbi:hypothetical protein EV191_101106 [Tamaricihabitans halophyticus]|uniref:SnoaL-like domain-containing protein n=1 Tax=Tamaricihabitans halophyticus TaxID=1262583 RepID=A0A4V6NRF6_9PSEU|nr:nuclear transport factor 2 family protein [Tamaricihabitans halophyticus]TCP56166.1 hypothetical protein EV191_101106 [Tamaricihabitans halophyticus]